MLLETIVQTKGSASAEGNTTLTTGLPLEDTIGRIEEVAK